MKKIVCYSIGVNENNRLKDASVITDNTAWMFMKGAEKIDDIIDACEKNYVVPFSESHNDVRILYLDKMNVFVFYDKSVSDVLIELGADSAYCSKSGLHLSIAQDVVRNMSKEDQEKISLHFNEPYALFDETKMIKSILK